MNLNYKDWQIAQSMFGKNTKKECKLVSELRKYGYTKKICDGWYLIIDQRLMDDTGWIISSEYL